MRSQSLQRCRNARENIFSWSNWTLFSVLRGGTNEGIVILIWKFTANLLFCFSVNSSSPAKSRLFEGTQIANKSIWGAVKSAGSSIKSTTQQAAALASNQMKSTVGIKDPTRIEKRISDEFHKMFDDSDSFYYCLDGDITNNLQRRQDQPPDDRFIWNKHMLKDIFKLGDESWILPIIQGFVQLEHCVIGNECFTLALVSRRSRYRAGTR